MRPFFLLFLCAFVITNAGCGGADQAAKGNPAQLAPVVAEPECADCPNQGPASGTPIVVAAGSSGEVFQGLEYANWKQFKVGTIVKRRSLTTTVNGPGRVISINTFELANIADNVIEVSRQNTTDRGEGFPVKVNPGSTFKYYRQFPIPNGMTADNFNKPSLKAKKTGEEELTVLGKKYKSTIYKWTDSTEAGPMEVTVWLSEEMPGRIVKQTMVQPQTNTTVEEVIEITLK